MRIAPGGALLIWGILERLSPDSAGIKNPIANMIVSQKSPVLRLIFSSSYSFFCAPACRTFFIESQLKVRDSMSRAILRAGASKKGKQTFGRKAKKEY